MNITIFPQEVSDGLEASIKNNSIACLSVPVLKKLVSTDIPKAIAEANPNQLDLFYIESILASVGWNNNDDVFDAMELWAARNSPVDKPFNFMHNESDIIGHITSSKLIDRSGNALLEPPLPEQFDIAVGSVIYKRWDNKDRQSKIDQIIAGIAENKWFVSMECLFPNFDYAVVGSDNQHKIIARTEESSYLTKYLRIYGGPGSYQGYKLGRMLRDFTFSGKGLVDRPANPRSHIVAFSSDNEVSIFNAAARIKAQEIFIMPDTYTKDQYETLLSEQNKSVASLQDVNTRLEAALKQVEILSKSEASMKQVMEETTKAKDAQIADLTLSITKANEQAAEAEKKMKEMKDEKAKCERLAKLMARKIDEAKAKELVNKFLSVADELFEEVVSAYPEREQVETPVVAEVVAANPEVASEAVVVAETVTPQMAVANENNDITIRNKAVAWLMSGKKQTKNKKEI